MTSNVLHLIATIPVDLFRLYRIGFQHKLPNRIDFFRKTTPLHLLCMNLIRGIDFHVKNRL